MPNTGLTASASTSVWQTGVLSSLPATVQNLISNPNCETAADCQENQHCINVATDTACAHNKCQTGPVLSPTCNDDCVTNICTQSPACCQSVPTCKLGEILSPDGTRCYYYNTNELTWPDAQANCKSRGSNWDLLCIGTVAEDDFIGNQNGDDAWIGVERVTYYNPASAFKCSNGETPLANGLIESQRPWGDGEPNYFDGNPENCTEIYGGTGHWNDQSCDTPMNSWCEGPALPPSGWTSGCAQLVASVCGATCDTTGTNPPASCQTWNAGESNPNDTGPDLSIGVPCGGQVPVCNHGTQVAPSGAIVHVLPTSATFGSLSPSISTQLGSCTTTNTITPGACIMVDGCTPYLGSNAELWVSYPTTGTESRVDDNWGFNYPGSACGAPQCLPGSGPCFTSTTKTYDYEGACPKSGQVPQWSFLTFDSTAPGDSSIVFSIGAAPSVAQVATEPATVVARVTHAGGNERCDLAGPTSNCPVDLYSALLPSATTGSAVLRLTITLNPSSDGAQSPVLSGWRISYSCPAGT